MIRVRLFFLSLCLLLPGCSCDSNFKTIETVTSQGISQVKNISSDSLFPNIQLSQKQLSVYLEQVKENIPVLDKNKLLAIKTEMGDFFQQLPEKTQNTLAECSLLWGDNVKTLLEWSNQGKEFFQSFVPGNAQGISEDKFVRVYSALKSLCSAYHKEKREKIYYFTEKISNWKYSKDNKTFGEYSTTWIHEKFPGLKGTSIAEEPVNCVILFLLVNDVNYLVSEMKLVKTKNGVPVTLEQYLKSDLNEKEMKLILTLVVRLRNLSDGKFQLEDITSVTEIFGRVIDTIQAQI